MWVYNNSFVEWCISTSHILSLDFSCWYTSLSFGFFLFTLCYWNDNPIRRIQHFNWGKRSSFGIVVLTECYWCGWLPCSECRFCRGYQAKQDCSRYIVYWLSHSVIQCSNAVTRRSVFGQAPGLRAGMPISETAPVNREIVSWASPWIGQFSR